MPEQPPRMRAKAKKEGVSADADPKAPAADSTTATPPEQPSGFEAAKTGFKELVAVGVWAWEETSSTIKQQVKKNHRKWRVLDGAWNNESEQVDFVRVAINAATLFSKTPFFKSLLPLFMVG